MKTYTNIEQSHKLAEILPIESADMCYINNKPHLGLLCEEYYEFGDTILQDYYPCWSLAALLNVIGNIFKYNLDYNGTSFTLIVGDFEITNETTVDACYEMIVKLNELKLFVI